MALTCAPISRCCWPKATPAIRARTHPQEEEGMGSMFKKVEEQDILNTDDRTRERPLKMLVCVPLAPGPSDATRQLHPGCWLRGLHTLSGCPPAWG